MFRQVEHLCSRAAVAFSWFYTPGQAAVAWTLRLPAVTGAIVGARNAGQVEGVMTAGDWRLTPDELSEVEG